MTELNRFRASSELISRFYFNIRNNNVATQSKKTMQFFNQRHLSVRNNIQILLNIKKIFDLLTIHTSNASENFESGAQNFVKQCSLPVLYHASIVHERI